MALALLFPGQGSQHPQMLPWLDAEPGAAATLAILAQHLGTDWRQGLGSTALHANRMAQLLMTGLGIATWQALAPQLPAPTAVAGYSVGELAACCVAGALDADTALTLAAARAGAMDAAAEGQPGGLLSVQGPQAGALAQAAPGLAVAIRIGPDRALVGGPVAALDDAADRWRAAGLRCTRLPISVASHTPWMAPAARAFGEQLARVSLRVPRLPIVCNRTGMATRDPARLATALAEQLAATVRWDDCMDSLAERGVRCVLEVGPGSALAGLWRERHPGIPVRSADEFRSPQGLVAWVSQQLGE